MLSSSLHSTITYFSDVAAKTHSKAMAVTRRFESGEMKKNDLHLKTVFEVHENEYKYTTKM